MRLSFYSSYIALWALAIFQGLLILALVGQLAKLRRVAALGGFSEDQLPEGSRAPEFIDTHRGSKSGVRGLEGSGGVLLFLSSECLVCRGLTDSLGRAGSEELPLVIAFCQGREKGCAAFAKRLGSGARMILDSAEDTAARYQISRFPTAVMVDAQRKIRGYCHPRDLKELKQAWYRISSHSSGTQPGAKISAERVTV